MGTPQRRARVITNPASVGNGPLLVYWYGTGGNVTNVTAPIAGIGAAAVQRITSAGGVVVAPEHINDGIFPWINGDGVDHPFMDEIVACAVEKANIDPRRIHSTGYSAGALYTGQLGLVRSQYLASIATFSGGGTPPPAGSNKFAALIFHGGPGDMVVLNFMDSSVAYHNAMKNAGHFAAICNHAGGHVVPGAAVDGVLTFFDDHPFGTNPSPYAGALPGHLPNYCQL
jgi:predicted esterase